MNKVIYQPLIMGENPYTVYLTSLGEFPPHWHSEIEMIYCVSGSFVVKTDHTAHTVTAGKCVFVGSAQIHSCYECTEDAEVLVIEMGAAFLGEEFRRFSERRLFSPVIDTELTENILLKNLLTDICCVSSDDVWHQKGCLYLLASYMLSISDEDWEYCRQTRRRIAAVADIQSAIDYVAENYKRNISVEEISAYTGYGKSNFCRHFKSLTHMSFHRYLNMFRMKNACILLRSTSMSVSEIAAAVGIPVEKSFDRIFRQHNGTTPTQYRMQFIE